MESSDFVGSQILEKKIYRKTFNGETKVNSLKTKEILIKKSRLHVLCSWDLPSMKSTRNSM